jgi:filamentous hemagglutinin
VLDAIGLIGLSVVLGEVVGPSAIAGAAVRGGGEAVEGIAGAERAGEAVEGIEGAEGGAATRAGADDLAGGPRAAKGRLSLTERSRILQDAARGKGDYGLGSATSREADVLGRDWVGEGYKVASDGKTLVSRDGLRQYRPPTYKQNLGRFQANFERRFEGQITREWQGNGHLDVTGLP